MKQTLTPVLMACPNEVLHDFEESQLPLHSDRLHDVVPTQSSGLTRPAPNLDLNIVTISW